MQGLGFGLWLPHAGFRVWPGAACMRMQGLRFWPVVAAAACVQVTDLKLWKDLGFRARKTSLGAAGAAEKGRSARSASNQGEYTDGLT